jgi:hypothetical protein
MGLFLDALSDGVAQMTETLASVSQAFGAGWVKGLEALLDRPAALFYLTAFAAVVVFMMGGLRGAGRAGYQRGRFLTANEKSFLMTLDAALGRNYRAFAQVRPCRACEPDAWRQPRLPPPGVEGRHREERRFRDLRRLDARSGRRDRGRRSQPPPARAPATGRLRQCGVPRDRTAAHAGEGEARLFRR